MYFAYCTHDEKCAIIRRGDDMGRTSSAVKDRYNARVYDEIKVRVPKGRKAELQAYVMERGESVNAFINRAISKQMEEMERDS